MSVVARGVPMSVLTMELRSRRGAQVVGVSLNERIPFVLWLSVSRLQLDIQEHSLSNCTASRTVGS